MNDEPIILDEFAVIYSLPNSYDFYLHTPKIGEEVFHITDFIGNKLALGKLVQTAEGGEIGGIPIFSPKDGVFNMQFTMNNLQLPKNDLYTSYENIDMFRFIQSKLDDVSTYNKWLLIPIVKKKQILPLDMLNNASKFVFSDSNLDVYYNITDSQTFDQ